MIMYDYQCAECEHLFEEYAKMDDLDLISCSECGKMAASRQFTACKLFKGLPYGNGRSHKNVEK